MFRAEDKFVMIAYSKSQLKYYLAPCYVMVSIWVLTLKGFLQLNTQTLLVPWQGRDPGSPTAKTSLHSCQVQYMCVMHTDLYHMWWHKRWEIHFFPPNTKSRSIHNLIFFLYKLTFLTRYCTNKPADSHSPTPIRIYHLVRQWEQI